jgi:hypothetical protein
MQLSTHKKLAIEFQPLLVSGTRIAIFDIANSDIETAYNRCLAGELK